MQRGDAGGRKIFQREIARRNGVDGRTNMVDNIRAGMKTVGRFGWKSQVPTIIQFAGDAYLNELGVTSPDFPTENCPQGNCAELAFNPAPGINDDGGGPEVSYATLSKVVEIISTADSSIGQIVQNHLASMVLVKPGKVSPRV